MEIIEKGLKKFNKFQMKKPFMFLFFVLVFTLVMGYSATNIYFSSDFMDQLPQDIDAIQSSEMLYDKIGGSDHVVVLLEADVSEEGIKDIRDPEAVESIFKLHRELEDEPLIDNVESVASFFGDGNIPDGKEGVKRVLSQVEGTDNLFNKQYTATMVEITANIPDDEVSIQEFNEDVEENVEQVGGPYNLDGVLTGTTPLRVEILGYLESDMMVTTLWASVLIYLFISLVKKSFKWGAAIFVPLLFGLTWTLGTIAIIDIPVTIATVMVGPMILGMAVEYGSFAVERYKEEVSETPTLDEVRDGLNGSIPYVGASMTGSATTATAGFLALLIATFPMIEDLGIFLALGIINSLLSALVVSPLLIFSIEYTSLFFRGGGESD